MVRNINSNTGNRRYKAESGDVMKLGRIKFKIKAVQIGGRRSVCTTEDEDQSLKSIRNIT